jgi:hypothetical protein
MISLTKKAAIAALCIIGTNGSSYMNKKEGKAHLKMNKNGKFKIL